MHTCKHTQKRSQVESRGLFVCCSLAALLRVYRWLLKNVFFFSPQKYTGCLPTSLWQDLCNAHTESSDTEPETRKIFTCVEDVNKCSLFTHWDQSHPPVLDLKACGGGGWMRWDMKERNVSMRWNGKCWWSCQINTLVREESQHASMSLRSESEWGHLTSRADTRKQTDVTRLSVKSCVRSFSINESNSKKSTQVFINQP